MRNNKIDIIQSIYDKHLEVSYNEKKLKINGKTIHVQLQGKITCPILNYKISSLVCSKLMDNKGWPRHCDPAICDSANCKIYKSIRNNMKNKKNEKPRRKNS